MRHLIRATVSKRNWEMGGGSGEDSEFGRKHCPGRIRAPKDIKVF